MPKLQSPGPLAAPHQFFFAVATEVLSFAMPPALVVSKLLVATVSFGAMSPAVSSEAIRMASWSLAPVMVSPLATDTAGVVW